MSSRTWMMAITKGSAYDMLGRALWNLFAPLHGEPPCYAPGEEPWPTLDLADTDVVAHLLPHTNVSMWDEFGSLRR